MRKILFMLLLISSSVNAQEIVNLVKEMKCSNVEFIMKEFSETYGESPVWVSKTLYGSHITLMANKTKKTWTIIEYDDKMACVVSIGNNGSNPDFSI